MPEPCEALDANPRKKGRSTKDTPNKMGTSETTSVTGSLDHAGSGPSPQKELDKDPAINA
jgi:hypothetical protein